MNMLLFIRCVRWMCSSRVWWVVRKCGICVSGIVRFLLLLGFIVV